jgi:exonuclease SbcD
VELAARPFVTIKVDARDPRDPTQSVLKAINKRDLKDAVVRVLITTTPETDTLINQRAVEAALGNAAFIAAVQREVDYPVRARLGVDRPEGLSPKELLERYLISKDTPPDRLEILRQYAEQLFADAAPGLD